MSSRRISTDRSCRDSPEEPGISPGVMGKPDPDPVHLGATAKSTSSKTVDTRWYQKAALGNCLIRYKEKLYLTPDIVLTPILQLPSHLCVVYKRGDPKNIEYVAKRLRKGSIELAILEYLNTKQPRSSHVIQYIEAIPSTEKEWLILPIRNSLGQQSMMNRISVPGRVQLGWDLIKGLAYLHQHKIAHRDIKPDNLVCDDDFRLQIIDFDVAIKVQDENTAIGEYRGTEGWTAPEMGTEDGPTPMHSPIKADRWSCGRVLLRHIMIEEIAKIDQCLLEFARQLMANDPRMRPSLLEWPNLFTSPFSDVANVVKKGRKEVSRPRKDVAAVDRESIKPPNARPEQPKEPYSSTRVLRSMGNVF